MSQQSGRSTYYGRAWIRVREALTGWYCRVRDPASLMERDRRSVPRKHLRLPSFVAFVCAVLSLLLAATLPAYAQATMTTKQGQGAPFGTGQVLKTFPLRGAHCALPGRISVTVSATRAQGSAYVNVRMNTRCQLITVSSGYGTIGIPNVRGTTMAITPTHGVMPGISATSTCSATAGADVVDLSTDTTGAEVTQFLPFQYPCGGNTFDAGATPYASCYDNQFLNYTAYDCASAWDYEYASQAESTGSAFIENNPWPNTFFSGNMSVQNTTDLSNWTIYANCSWDSTLSASGDTFHCASHWS